MAERLTLDQKIGVRALFPQPLLELQYAEKQKNPQLELGVLL